MTYTRNIPKTLSKFMRKEVLQTRALWGELRRVKKQTIMQTGLPNIPKLIVTQDPNVAYIAVIRNVRELRIYAFDRGGFMLPARSFYDEEADSTWVEIQKQSKRLIRFPKQEKPLTPGKRNVELTNTFKKLWLRITSNYDLPRKHPPFLSYVSEPQNEIWGSRCEGDFVFIPLNSANLKSLFGFYTFYYLLPLQIREFKYYAEQIAFFLLGRLKSFKSVPTPNWSGKTLTFGNWVDNSNQVILASLYEITDYFPANWTEERIQAVIDTRLTANYPVLFKNIFEKTKEIDFFEVGMLLEYLSSGVIPEKSFSSVSTNILKSLNQFEFKPVLKKWSSDVLSKKYRNLLQRFLEQRFKDILELSISKNSIQVLNKSDLEVELLMINEKLLPHQSTTIYKEDVSEVQYTVRGIGASLKFKSFTVDIKKEK